ncbi:hypothetical protein D3C72_1915790 [compost metagenome]
MSILSSISARAVMTSTGASTPAARSSRMTRNPSLPGRLMSSTSASQVSSRPQRKAATPSRTHCTLWPADRNLLSTASPRSRLSSTSRMRMFCLRFVVFFFCFGGGVAAWLGSGLVEVA